MLVGLLTIQIVRRQTWQLGRRHPEMKSAITQSPAWHAQHASGVQVHLKCTSILVLVNAVTSTRMQQQQSKCAMKNYEACLCIIYDVDLQPTGADLHRYCSQHKA